MVSATISICIPVMLLLILAAQPNSGKVQKLKCFVCSHSTGTDCDFLEYIADPATYLQACDNPVVNNKTIRAKCSVQITTENGVRFANRTCGPIDCPAEAKCCQCSKKGCNGDNKCNFYSSSTNWYPTKLLIIISCFWCLLLY